MNPKENHIFEGNCLDVMSEWDDGCIDHCITDPPYNMSYKKQGLSWAYSSHVTMSEKWDNFSREDYLEFSRAWLTQVCRVVRPNGNIFIFGSYHNIYDLGFIINDLGLRIVNSLTWFKPNAQPNITCRMLTESTEHAIWVCNGKKEKANGWIFNYEIAKKLNGGKQMRNMWSIPYPSSKERRFGKHPSQKSLELIARIILIASRPNDLILDCFSGSGTMGVAAQNLGRRWVMVEQNSEYNQIARHRLDGEKFSAPEELFQLRFDTD
jgi:site-specific DNA-methyltransferase (adenine-specific)